VSASAGIRGKFVAYGTGVGRGWVGRVLKGDGSAGGFEGADDGADNSVIAYAREGWGGH
jgi:hypothetical protein